MHLYQKFISRHVAVIVVGSMVPCILAYATTPKPQTAITEMEIATQSEATQDESIIIEKNRKQAELKAMVLQLAKRGTSQEKAASPNYRKIGFTYTEDMYLQLSGNDVVPDDWEEEMDPLMENLIEEENTFTEESNTDDGANEKAWEPVNALDASRYAWAIASTDELPEALDAARAAQKRLGFPYSQPRRDSGIAYDCSSLVYWAYRDAGVNIDPVNCHTAASIAEYLEANGKGIDAGDLKAGDLIFYSYKQNGRYKNISHVAMVCDNGLMVQASSTLGRVVMSEISLSKAVSIARPVTEHIETKTIADATPSEALDISIDQEEPVTATEEAVTGPAASPVVGATQETEGYGPGYVSQSTETQ